MGKSLIIAEKPSVAADVARALGGFKRHKDYYESDDYVLSSAVGHLLEQTPPEGAEAKRGKWSFANLPVIPPYFDLHPIQKSEARLKLLVKLIRRRDVDALVNACDAGREGELIFRNIVRHAKAKQPIKRLWLQSMTPDAIRNGFARLREDREMQPLADAALSRSEADWLVGINGTRAMTAFNSKPGGFYKTTVGRVQTPTLAIVVEREAAIRDFQPQDYWEVAAVFRSKGGEYAGRWFDEGFRRKEDEPHARAERIWDPAAAAAIRDKCLGKTGTVTEESKPTTQMPPLLFDLTSLQREANARFGMSASRTVQIAQALYERHKVLTYPRTDSRALPEDYLGTVRDSLRMLAKTSYAPFAKAILDHRWVKPDKRIFNNAKVSDHFAIIPTTETPTRLNETEQRIYDVVTRRFLAIFHPAARYLETTRITRVEQEPFKTTGKVLVEAGWLAVHGKDRQEAGTAGRKPNAAPARGPADPEAPAAAEHEAETRGREAEPTLAPVSAGEEVETRDAEVRQSQTRPPARFTEATLLGSMEGAGKLVNDEELRAAMAGKGLGTSATRASIIEGLIDEDYLIRDGKEIQATPKAFMLMELLNGLGVRELTSPELTGNWEHQLFQMQGGNKSRDEFMGEIAAMTRQIVERARQYEHDTIPGDFGSLSTPCPKCGGEVRERYRNFQCAACDFTLPKILAGRLLDADETAALIRQGQVGPLQGFRSRQGRPFAAVLQLSPEHKIAFDFGGEARNGDGEAEPSADFTDQEPLGQCPRCAGRVFELPMRYVCENAVGDPRTCEFSSGKIILRQPVDREQMAKLLADGKTDLLPQFVSSRTGRPFKAFLALQQGKVGFEFEPRPARKTAAKRDQPAPRADFTGQEPLGPCPRCRSRVFEWNSRYLCEKSQAETRPCKFKSGTVILEQPVDRAQMAKLLSEGKTDLLEGFVSSRSGRPFAAWLVLDDAGKVAFEFPPRDE